MLSTLREREQLMGYKIDATDAGHVTIQQRLGQVMDGNTMRCLGAYLNAIRQSVMPSSVLAVKKRKFRQRSTDDILVALDHDEVHHHLLSR